jgi:ferredoxin
MKNAWSILWALVKGSLITSRHFFTNLWFHSLRLFGIKNRRPGAVTIQYPEKTKPLAARHRSAHRLMKRPDGKPRCVACLLCVTVCPSECLYVEAAADPDPDVQKYAGRFEIDLTRGRGPDGHRPDRSGRPVPRRPDLGHRRSPALIPGRSLTFPPVRI